MKIYDISQEVFSCQVYPVGPEGRYFSDEKISKKNACSYTESFLWYS